MGNKCAGFTFFGIIEPLSRKGKGSAYIHKYSFEQTKREINNHIKIAKKEKQKSTFIELALSSFPEEVVRKAIIHFTVQGYLIDSALINEDRAIRLNISW